MTIMINWVSLCNPANTVPAVTLNVLPHVLHLYRGLLLPWLTIFPCPISPLDGHSKFGQNCDLASTFCGTSVAIFFIDTTYRRGCLSCKSPRTPPGVLPILMEWKLFDILYFCLYFVISFIEFDSHGGFRKLIIDFWSLFRLALAWFTSLFWWCLFSCLTSTMAATKDLE
jgi:hypothetical protein